MTANDARDIVEARRVGQVFAHLGAPPLAVALNDVVEPLGEGAWVEALGPSFALEEWSDIGER
jgi:hypothetical protein